MTTSPILYAGKHISEVLAPAVLGGDSVSAGLWKLLQGFQSKAVYTALNFADTLTAGNFCGNGTASASTLSEVVINLSQIKADFTICKDNFRGTFIEDNYAPAIEAYLNTSMGKYAQFLENLRWSGATASAIPALAIQDGAITQLVTGATFIPVAGASAAAITAPATVIAELNKALAVVPSEVRYSVDFAIIMAPQVYQAYQQAAWADGNFNAGLYQFLNQAATSANPIKGSVGSFYNHPIFVATGLDVVTTAPSTKANRGVVLMGEFLNGRSNLLLATDLAGDMAKLNVTDLMPSSGNDSYRIQFMFKQGVGVANQNQIVMYR